MPDFWPDDFGTSDITSPRTILREQAAGLGRKTRGLLEGLVTTDTQKQTFLQSLFIVAPSLGNYRYRLLMAAHPIQLYPVSLTIDVLDHSVQCANEEQFKEKLREVFNSPQTKTIILALLSQINEEIEDTREPSSSR